MIINGFIKSQDLSLSVPIIVSDTINYLEFRFYFKTAEWEGLTKWAHFAQGNLTFEVPLQNDEIPAEEALSLPAGPWKVYIHGSRYENGEVIQRITTDQATFMVQKTGCGCGGPLPIVPVSVGERLEARIEALEQGGGGGTGASCKNGVTFTPRISENKILSWTNDGGLENPEPVDLHTDSVITVLTKEDLPNLNSALTGVIYFDQQAEDGYIVNADKTGWIRVIHAIENVALEDIPESELGATVATAAMVKDYVDKQLVNNDYGEV